MTTRRKFLSASGILAGMAIFGKLFGQSPAKEEKTIIAIDSAGGESRTWQDETPQDCSGMGEHLKNECGNKPGGIKKIWYVSTNDITNEFRQGRIYF